MRLKWGIDQLFFYLVCFVMLLTIILGATNLVRAGIDFFLPVPDNHRIENPKMPPGSYGKSTLPEHIIEREREQQQKITAEISKKNNFNSSMSRMLGSIAQIIIALPVYLYHWRKIPLLDN